MSALQLSPVQARVIAVMVEKSIATPAYYPMTVNAILLAANQKSARQPLMNLTEGEVGGALNELEALNLVTRDSFSGRVQKWRQQFLHQLLLKPQTQALLVTLILRGPQTLAELRAHAEALGGPTEVAAVQAGLEDLADRAHPLVVQLPRAPGQSAVRFAHTLSGVPEAGTELSPAIATPAPEPGLAARVEALEARLAALEARLTAAGG